MARHDYQCPGCGATHEVDVPAAIGAQRGAPICPACRGMRMAWIPQIGRMDFAPSGGAGFTSFSIKEDIRGKTECIEIDSLHKLRQVERESEQRARNGEGRPLVWRDYHQNRSNGDVHTLAKDLADPHGVRETITPKVQSGTVTPRRGDVVTKTHGTL